MPARTTGARGVASVNQAKRYAVTNGTVLYKRSQLVEAPTVVLSPLRLSQPYPVANTRKVFELQFAPGAFSRFNEALRNLVVGIAPETRFSTRNLLQPTPSRAGTAFLQARTVALELLAGLFNVGSRKRFAVGGGGYLRYAEVYAQCARRLRRRFVGKLALQVDVPLALSASDKLSALDREGGAQKVPLIPADFERDSQPPVNRGQRNGFVLDLDRKDTLVVVNRGGLEAACALPLALPDSGYGPDRKVGAKAKLRADVLVGQLLEMVLVKALRLPSDSQDVVARRRKSVYCPTQAFGLTWLGYQLAAHAQEGHNYA
jgi:hypothetical protein